MKEKDKKKKRGLPDFLKYMERKLKGRERNAFERELQKDPFAEEASEGLESIDPDLLRTDMRRMKARLLERTGRKRIPVLYRVAASLLILLAAGTLITISVRKGGKSDDKLAIINNLTETADTSAKESGKAGNEKTRPEREEATEPVSQKEKEITVRDEVINVPVSAAIPEAAQKAVKEDAERDTVAYLKAADEVQISEKKTARALAQPALAASDVDKSEILIKGRIVSSEDNLPLSGVTVHIKGTTVGTMTDVNGNFSFPASSVEGQQLVASYIGMKSTEFEAKSNSINEIKLDPDITALEEVVVVGYGVARKQEVTGAATRIEMTDKTPYLKYIPPEPEGGREEYDRYIEQSIRKPLDFREGDRKIVVVSFYVLANGRIDSLKVLRSGGESYSAEAMRLVKEGPSWMPATENGKKIDDEVRIRIVFK